MTIPSYPPSADDDTRLPRSRRRVVVAVICVLILLASLHVLRTALG